MDEMFGGTNATAERSTRSRNRHTNTVRKNPSAQTADQEKELPDPVAADSTERRLVRAARQLADLLREAKPLVDILNSPGTPHSYRAAVRDWVGLDRYFVLVTRLQAMTSQRAWEAAYPYEPIPPELIQRMKALGIDIAQP